MTVPWDAGPWVSMKLLILLRNRWANLNKRYPNFEKHTNNYSLIPVTPCSVNPLNQSTTREMGSFDVAPKNGTDKEPWILGVCLPCNWGLSDLRTTGTVNVTPALRTCSMMTWLSENESLTATWHFSKSYWINHCQPIESLHHHNNPDTLRTQAPSPSWDPAWYSKVSKLKKK